MKPKAKPQFIMHTRALRESAAWRAMSGKARMLIDLVELEHLRHGGQDNGRLIVTYANMRKRGLGHRRTCAHAIRELEILRLAEVTHGRAGQGGHRAPNLFRLTYLPANRRDPTNEWQTVLSVELARAEVAAVKLRRKPPRWVALKVVS
jgi:hypothetical protein